MRNRIATAVAALVGSALLLTGIASAAPVNPAGSGAARQAAVEPNSVYSASIVDGQVGQADIYAGAWDYLLRTNAPNSVWTSTLNNSVVTEDKLHPAVRAKLNAGDVKGSVGVTVDIERQTIENIGGSFAARATQVGSFELPAGTWMVTTSATFYRKVSGAEGTRPQLALRYNELAGNAGTILGQEISETANRELMQSITWRVTVPEATTVTVYGFGYNDDTSAAGGGEIDVDAQITAVRG